MKRKNKNKLTIVLVFLLLLGTYFTMHYAKNYNQFDKNRFNMEQRNRIENDMGEPQKKPSTDNPEGLENTDESTENKEHNSQTIPENPDKEDNFSIEGNNPSEKMKSKFNKLPFPTIIYIILGVESLLISLLLIYLLMSKFNKKTFKETIFSSNKLIVYLLSVIILTCGIVYLDTTIYTKYFREDKPKIENKKDQTSIDNSATQ